MSDAIKIIPRWLEKHRQLAPQFLDVTEILSDAKLSGELRWGWVNGWLYEVYPGGRMVRWGR